MRQRKLKTEDTSGRPAGQFARSSRLSRLAIGALAGCFVLTAAPTAKTKSLPTWARFSSSFMSTEMTDVTVRFAHWVCDLHRHNCYWGKTVRGEMVERNKSYQDIAIPRAYVWSAMPFSKDRRSNFHHVDDLPNPVVTNRLHIQATLPDMAPLSTTWTNWDGIKNKLAPLDVSLGKTRHTKREDIRKLTMSVRIRTTAHGFDARDTLQKIVALRMKAIPVPKYLGFDSFRAGSSHYLLPDNDPQEIAIIECLREPEKARETKYCKHVVPLNSKLTAEISFIDFRANGGIEFMRQRIRAFKVKFCPIFKCDARAVGPSKKREQG